MKSPRFIAIYLHSDSIESGPSPHKGRTPSQLMGKNAKSIQLKIKDLMQSIWFTVEPEPGLL
jgi:hypothetical protein